MCVGAQGRLTALTALQRKWGGESLCPPPLIWLPQLQLKQFPMALSLSRHLAFLLALWASQVALVVKDTLVNAGDIRNTGSIPGLGRSPGGGHGNPHQYCWESPMDRGAWRATVCGVKKESGMT